MRSVKLIDMFLRKINGAVEKSKVEPLFSADVLSELEDWSDNITRDPMVMRALEALDQETVNGSNPKPKPVMRRPHP